MKKGLTHFWLANYPPTCDGEQGSYFVKSMDDFGTWLDITA